MLAAGAARASIPPMSRISDAQGPPPAPDGPVYLDAELRPNRSLSLNGFQIVMVVMAAASFAVGCLFLAMGAWPVIGFFGLDVLLLWLAFRASYRAGARERELVRVTAARVDVARADARGQTRWWTASPYFARVEVVEAEDAHPEISLRAGPDRLPLAVCLSPHERLGFAKALESALASARAERHPVGA